MSKALQESRYMTLLNLFSMTAAVAHSIMESNVLLQALFLTSLIDIKI